MADLRGALTPYAKKRRIPQMSLRLMSTFDRIKHTLSLARRADEKIATGGASEPQDMTEKNKQLSQFGFSFKRSGTHTARTMMLNELKLLLLYVNWPEAGKNEYFQAIKNDNCLGKRSGKTRILTYRYLTELYSLDYTTVIFRALRYFWDRDSIEQPLLDSGPVNCKKIKKLLC